MEGGSGEEQAAPGERVPIFTLPGNPVSAYVSFQVFARPAIGAMMGYDGLALEKIQGDGETLLRVPAKDLDAWMSRFSLGTTAFTITPDEHLQAGTCLLETPVGTVEAAVIVSEIVAEPVRCWSSTILLLLLICNNR